MGILNITPDSFSDGGKFFSIDDALFRAEQMIKEGADIIDIGGQSTRPGHIPVSAEEEIERVLPVLSALKKRFDTPISVDTYYSAVAEAAAREGAGFINDIWGLKFDSNMAGVIAKHKVACCLMYNKDDTVYENLIEETKKGLLSSADVALKAGISPEQIVLDPGIGFGKTQEQNLECLARLGEFCDLGFPMLLGASRKSVVGNVLGLPVGERLEGTLATTVLAIQAGYAFVRVHDIKENARVIKMTEEIKKWTK